MATIAIGTFKLRPKPNWAYDGGKVWVGHHRHKRRTVIAIHIRQNGTFFAYRHYSQKHGEVKPLYTRVPLPTKMAAAMMTYLIQKGKA